MSEPLSQQELNVVRDQVTSMLGAEDALFIPQSISFVEQRLEVLEARDIARRVNATNGNFQGFIGPKTVISPNALGIGYALDDTSMYAQALPLMRRFYGVFLEITESPESAYLNAALTAAQYAQSTYFGTHNASGALEQREDLLADLITEDTPSQRSIAEFRGVAMCAERAAVANNVLHLFGFNPVFEMGRLKIADEPERNHAFLIIKDTKGGELIFDPTNPTLIFAGDNQLVEARPTTVPVGSITSPRNPEAVVEDKHKTHTVVGEEVQTTVTDYRYKLGFFGTELHPE